MKKIFIILLTIVALFTLTACEDKKEKEPTNNGNQEQQKEEKKEEEYNDNDDIVEYDDEDNKPPENEKVVVNEIINCDGCVYSYFAEGKSIGSSITKDEYTTDISTIKTKGGKQRHNFFGFVLSGDTISRAYSCIYKDYKIYCIEGSTNGAYFDSNVSILNTIFTANNCKYLSNGNTYRCTDGSYNGDTKTGGYASLHYETSCTIYGRDAKTGQLECN